MDPTTLRIAVISDTHGRRVNGSDYEGCDAVIYAGDFTSREAYKSEDRAEHRRLFLEGLEAGLRNVPCAVKIAILGNHDMAGESGLLDVKETFEKDGIIFLNDESRQIKIKGIKLEVYGSPLSFRKSVGGNAFTYVPGTNPWVSDGRCVIPPTTQILVTHGPPHDLVRDSCEETTIDDFALDRDMTATDRSCVHLRDVTNHIDDLLVHICGHVHNGRGIGVRSRQDGQSYMLMNGSAVLSGYRKDRTTGFEELSEAQPPLFLTLVFDSNNQKVDVQVSGYSGTPPPWAARLPRVEKPDDRYEPTDHEIEVWRKRVLAGEPNLVELRSRTFSREWKVTSHIS